MTREHWHNSKNHLGFNDTAKYFENWDMGSSLPLDTSIDMRRAYYATVSYVDSLVGELIAELDRLQVRNTTIVSFCSDHGYQLGEHGIWGKDTNMDAATNVPVMISIPGRTDFRIDSFQSTEMVDLFPTLVDAAGLPSLPLCPVEGSGETPVCREGTSLMPLLHRSNTVKWKDRVFSQYPFPDCGEAKSMGYSIRTNRFLYVEWIELDKVLDGVWPSPFARELYDNEKDVQQDVNVADDPVYAKDIEVLSKQLSDGWRAALPESS
jgi:iduronate 2-sulfatase